MFTGKTTELIRRLEEAGAHGHHVLAVKPHIDTRYHATALSTHDNRFFDGATIASPAELPCLAEESAARGGLAKGCPDVLGLDEAHFFREGLHDAVMQIVARGTRVILAGLDRTSMNEPFGEMARLLIEADEVTKLPGVCAVCGRPACHTIRLFDSTEDIVVGGVGMFENRCRVHLTR
jgi:thymidine kinase